MGYSIKQSGPGFRNGSRVPLTEADLPPPETVRWVARRKEIVVAAVHAGLISHEEACRRYGLSSAEFESWRRQFEELGRPGLLATRFQHYQKILQRRTATRQ